MHLQTHAVSQAVTEVLTIACLRNDLTRHRIRLCSAHSRPDCLQGRLLSSSYCLVDPYKAGIRRAKADRAGDVRAIAVQPGAHVNQDSVAGLQGPVSRGGVSRGGMGGESHDRLEAQRVRPAGDNLLAKAQSQLLLGHPRA